MSSNSLNSNSNRIKQQQQQQLFETTASTIQAGDSSILLNNNNNNSNNQAQKSKQQNQNHVDLKCLNEFMFDSATNKKSLKSNNDFQPMTTYLRRYNSEDSSTPAHLQRYAPSHTAEQYQFHQSRKLHTENDLLPIESYSADSSGGFEQQQLKILSNIALNSNSSNMIIKRHMAAAVTTVTSNLPQSDKSRNFEYYSASSHEFLSSGQHQKQVSMSRKVAVMPNNSGNNYDYQDDKERQQQAKKQKKSEFMSSLEAAAGATSSSTLKFHHQPNGNPITTQNPSTNNLSYETAVSSLASITTKTSNPKNNATSSSSNIITASSWRIGEAIAKKQLKQHLQQLQENNNNATTTTTTTNPAAAKTQEKSPNQMASNSKREKKQPKYSECQLIPKPNAMQKASAAPPPPLPPPPNPPPPPPPPPPSSLAQKN
jgi:hypothetical protein